VPAIIYGFFGTSKQLAVGPLSIPALLIGAAVGSRNPATEDEYVGLVLVMSFLVGLFFMTLGLLRFGFIVNFVSTPVLNGFASGAAIITSCK